MDPFIAEIRAFGFNFPPRGWAACEGQLLPISQLTAVFSLVGTAYGGDGRTNFGLPDLRGCRVPISQGDGPGLSSRTIGETGGEPAVSLVPNEIPPHNHTMSVTNSPADVSSPGVNTAVARSTGKQAYLPPPAGASLVPLHNEAVSTLPSEGRPHNNLMPYQAVNYCIALQGVYPQRP